MQVGRSLLAIFVAVLLATAGLNMTQSFSQYDRIDGYLCINNQYVIEYRAVYVCAMQCTLMNICQAFSTADGVCKLFIFDKCSKNVRDCSCSRRGQVFVKQQSGLEPGKLCPSGYGDDLCGTKYKVLSGVDVWWPSKEKCESEKGLVIMADVIDAGEMQQVDYLWTKYGEGSALWLGGLQAPGSSEPSGGWYWVGCNIALNSSLWGNGEPDNYLNRENVIGRSHGHDKLADYSETWSRYRVLCECVSPFD